jgi:hypothetical protein
MIATEFGIIGAEVYAQVLKDVDRTLGGEKPRKAVFANDKGTVIGVGKRRAYLVVDLQQTCPVMHGDGFELYPYEGIKIATKPDSLGGHEINLISGATKRNTQGILVDWRGGVQAPVEEKVVSFDDDLSVIFELSAHETDSQSFISLLGEVDPKNELDEYGRTSEQGLMEDKVVSEVNFLATDIAVRAHEAGLTQPLDKGGYDKFSFETTLPVAPDPESSLAQNGLRIVRKKGQVGFSYTIFLLGVDGVQAESYHVNLYDGRLQQKLADKKYGNPVGPEVGRALIAQMQRAVIR